MLTAGDFHAHDCLTACEYLTRFGGTCLFHSTRCAQTLLRLPEVADDATVKAAAILAECVSSKAADIVAEMSPAACVGTAMQVLADWPQHKLASLSGIWLRVCPTLTKNPEALSAEQSCACQAAVLFCLVFRIPEEPLTRWHLAYPASCAKQDFCRDGAGRCSLRSQRDGIRWSRPRGNICLLAACTVYRTGCQRAYP